MVACYELVGCFCTQHRKVWWFFFPDGCVKVESACVESFVMPVTRFTKSHTWVGATAGM